MVRSTFALMLSLALVGCLGGGGSKHGGTHLDGGTGGDMAMSNNNCTGFGQQVCNGTCTNTNSDPFNCGGCGQSCDGTCVNGQCQTSNQCGSPNMTCNGVCTPVLSDPNNCGFCNNQCPTGQNCTNGSCAGGGGSLGCVGIIQCVNNCQDQTCATNCYNMGSSTGKQLYASLIQCIFGGSGGNPPGACPTANGGICDQMSASYNQTNCDNCISAAQMSGGACGSQTSACQSSP